VRDKAEETGLAMGSHQAIGAEVWIAQITRGQVKKTAAKSVKHISGKLKLLSNLVDLYKFSQDSEETIVEYSIEHLSNNNPEVRTQSYMVLFSVYCKINAKIRAYF
jgi:hypothetical protein